MRGSICMGRGDQKKRKMQVRILAALLLILLIDLARGQNMVQFAYSHFQACLLEFDLALTEYQENGDVEVLDSAKSAVQHVEHMDVGFLKYMCLSEPIYRKRMKELSNYLWLLSDYSEYLAHEVSLGMDMSEPVTSLCEGNREIEELLVEDSMNFDEIGRSTQKEVLEKIEQMSEMILNEMEE